MSFPIKGAEGGVHSSSPPIQFDQEAKVENPHWGLIEAARDGNRAKVEALLLKYPIPHSYLHSATGAAVKGGHLELAVDISQFAVDYSDMLEPERSPGKGQKAIMRVSPKQPVIEAPKFFANKYVNQIVSSPITGVAIGVIGVYIVGLLM